MRFAYIDSNGNEVPIPSVDALALRIELGAINQDTELYDAQADQWGPARTHEIFHTLSRAAEEEGFVAPPPPVPAPAPPRAPESEEVVSMADLVASEGDDVTEQEARAPDAVAEPEEAAELEPEEEPAASLSPSEQKKEALEAAGAGLTLAAAEDVPAEDPVADAFAEEAFDFGDISHDPETGSDLRAPATPEEPAGGFGDASLDFGSTQGGGFGEALEQPMEFSSAGFGEADGVSGGLDLEPPMSDFDADVPPTWMTPAEADEPDDAMDFSGGGDTTAAPVPVRAPVPTAADRRVPKDRPSPPKLKRQRSLVAPIVAVTLLGVVGVGAYVAYPIVMARLEESPPPPDPAAGLATLAPELQEAMRSVAGAGLARVFADAGAGAEGSIARPPRNWLAGHYFANAGEYQAVVDFWESVAADVEAVAAVDESTFRAAVEAEVAASGIAEDDRATVVDRAVAGFRAGSAGRAETLALVDALVDAALELHSFLVANQDGIDYVPAASATIDPVLEARPATPEIGDALVERIDGVTGALDRLDYVDVVTADGLWAAVLLRMQGVGVL